MATIAELLGAQAGRTAEDVVTTPFQPGESGFESFLRYAGRAGYGVRNLLTGNVEGAARQVGDILGDTVDAFLPGDLIPEFSRRTGEDGTGPGDYVEGSDLVGGMEPGFGKLAADIGLGLLTDPLTYTGVGTIGNLVKGGVKGAQGLQALNAAGKARSALSFGIPFTKAKAVIPGSDVALEGISNVAGKAYGALPQGTREGLESAGRTVRATFGERRVDPEVAPILDEAKAIQAASQQAGTGAAETLFTGVPKDQQALLMQALQGVRREGGLSKAGGAASPLPASMAGRVDPAMLDDLVGQNLAALGVQGDDLARLTQLGGDVFRLGGRQMDELVKEGAFAAPGAEGVLPYVQRAFSGLRSAEDEAFDAITGAPQATKARTLGSGEDVAGLLTENPDVVMDDFLARVTAKRGAQQGSILAKTKVARGLVDRAAKQADDKLAAAAKATPGFDELPEAERFARAGLSEAEVMAQSAKGMPLYSPGKEGSELATAANAVIKEIRKLDPETADAVEVLYRGMAPRGALMDLLAKGNRMFKPFATAGAFIPRINFTVRNVLTGGMWQVLANQKSRQVWPQYAKQAAGIILRSIDDGIEALTGKRFGPNELEQFNNAFAKGGGTIDGVLAQLSDPIAKEAVRLGVVTDGFAQAELLANQIARTGWSKKWRDLRDWPAAIAGGSEKRMRYATYKALRERGVPAEEAAKTISDTFFDYSIAGVENRAARDIIPFFQYSAKAIPQQFKFLRDNPGVMGAVRPLYTQDTADNPVYPYMEGSPIVPLGQDEAGNAEYLTSLGLPVEVLGDIPNLSGSPMEFLKQIRQDIVGQMTPPLKTIGAAVSGVDPYFGTPVFSYDKTPEVFQALGMEPNSELGRYYQGIKNTGLTQPVTGPIDYISQWLDSRKTPGTRLLGATTGARVVSVDEDRAMQQLIEDMIRNNPRIRQYTGFYQTGEDEEAQQLLDAVTATRARVREKRKAQAAVE